MIDAQKIFQCGVQRMIYKHETSEWFSRAKDDYEKSHNTYHDKGKNKDTFSIYDYDK